MNNNNLPISLREIYLNVLDYHNTKSKRSLKNLIFDRRHDFLVIGDELRVAVKIDYINERCYEKKDMRGVRRSVTISLIDTTEPHTIAKVRSCAYVPSEECTWSNVALIEVAPSSMPDFSHQLQVEVRDDKTGILLGEKELRIFPLHIDGEDISEAFEATSARVFPECGSLSYIAFNAEADSCHKVYFKIKAEKWTEKLAFVPEMEIRIYHPDGSIFQSFVDLQPHEGLENIYSAETSFLQSDSPLGIIYAEILYLDLAVAGIVFDAKSKEIYESIWTGRELRILPEYSYEAAEMRFKKCMDNKENDPFEKLLNEFISEQIEEKAEEDKVQPSDTNIDKENAAQYDTNVSPLRALDNLTGLTSVKEKLIAYEKLMIFNKMRGEKGLPTLNLPLHAMFCGSPGTGKTTVAKRMGLMLKRIGVLSKGQVVIRERSTLIGPYYSNEESKTLEAIEEAQGGILFIDEAYQLYQPNDPRDPGKFVIETLMTVLADETKRDWMLILAGYSDEMRRMLKMNPGLKSRIPESNIYTFDDFTESELMEIAQNYLDRHSYSMTTQAKDALAKRLSEDYHQRDKNFGNARHVINLIQTSILPSMAQRVVSSGVIDSTSLSEIQMSDIPQPLNVIKQERQKIGYHV